MALLIKLLMNLERVQCTACKKFLFYLLFPLRIAIVIETAYSSIPAQLFGALGFTSLPNFIQTFQKTVSEFTFFPKKFHCEHLTKTEGKSSVTRFRSKTDIRYNKLSKII